MENTKSISEVLKLPLIEKIRLLPRTDQSEIIIQIDALLKAHQPFALSACARQQTKD